jgi:3-hydroxyisobutyrate dehydrogenase-like beta-hydroxyacid dehydrogenase
MSLRGLFQHAGTLLERNFQEGFKLYLAAKDLRLAKELAELSGISPYLLEPITALFQSALKDSESSQIDYPIICRVLAQKLGIRNKGGMVP